MPAVKYEDLSLAFDFVSSTGPVDHEAYVSIDTGAIYLRSEDGAMEDEEIPPDLESSDRYVPVPTQHDLDLGASLALRFVEEELGHQYERVAGFFRHRGAYARFKDLLEAEGRLDRWYAFEADAIKRALRDWCAEHGFDLVE